MKIGILELKNYQFILDVAAKLGDIGTEFITAGEYDFSAEQKYRVIIDRLSFQDPYLKQIMMMASINGAYVVNNPFSCSINNKMLGQKVFEPFGVKQPKTFVLPRMSSDNDIMPFLKEPEWERIRAEMNFPCILKPFDGYAWDHVYQVGSFRELQNLYNALKEKCIMLVQEKIEYEDYFRVFCVGKKDVLVCKWIPRPMGRGEFVKPDQKKLDGLEKPLSELTIKINRVLDYDFNAVEWCSDPEGEIYMIDAMNEVPDIIKGQMPDEYYWWLVEKFSALVREKFHSHDKNPNTFCTQ
jgi:hypothetical protein